MASNEFRLVSPAIDNEGGGKLPRYCTQEGMSTKWDISPPLEWHNLPPKTKSLALVVQDIDAVDPTGRTVPLTHWVVVNIPVTVTRLPEGLSGKEEEMGDEYGGIDEGLNDWNVRMWRGPKMPNYGDRFEFRLYALDNDMHFDNQWPFKHPELGFLFKEVTKQKLLDAIVGHIVGEAVLTATF
ncbi:YbhB/YbcL [Sesbania bispinosa]|nr:YbhB/YbcL [Sesbania bispinosa]